jgi:hypothetical protein
LAFARMGFFGGMPGSKLEHCVVIVHSNQDLASGWKRCSIARNVGLGSNLGLTPKWNTYLFVVQNACLNLEGLASGR